MSNLLTQLGNNLLSVVALAGLIVLVCLGVVDEQTGLPLIVGIAGIHIGMAANPTSTVPGPGPGTLALPAATVAPAPVVDPQALATALAAIQQPTAEK